MRPKQFTLLSVEPTSTAGLLLHFADGERFAISLVDIIKRHPTLARLKDQAVFGTVRLGEYGASAVWADDDDLELAADNLRARAVEQAGGVSHEFIWNWMAQHGLSLDAAAEALGTSRRMLAYYRSGAKAVPRTVALACLGWERVARGEQVLAA